MDNYTYQLKGSSVSPFQALSSSECITLLTVFGTESVFTVTLNFLTIIVYLRERSLRKPKFYLVINLAVADMFNGGFAILIYSFLFGGVCNFSLFDEKIPMLLHLFILFFTSASIVNLAAVSIERMHATCRPLKHRLVEKRSFGAAVSAVWLTAGVCCYLMFTHVANFLFIFLSCCFLVLVSYSSIAIKIYCGQYPQHHGGERRERKLTKTLLIVTSASLLLVLPLIIYLFFRQFSPSSLDSLPARTLIYLHQSLLFLFNANSLVNPFLYAFRIPEFKKALFLFVACRLQTTRIQVFPLN